MILKRKEKGKVSTVTENKNSLSLLVLETHEVRLFVLSASCGSLRTVSDPNRALFREWLMRYIWSTTDNGP